MDKRMKRLGRQGQRAVVKEFGLIERHDPEANRVAARRRRAWAID